MKSIVLGLLAETSVHAGSGQSLGVVDLPIAREAATDYPVIPGSGIKGALRDVSRHRSPNKELTNRVFGQPDEAGGILVSDARLVLLPVRSLTGRYQWITCPHLLERFVRDLKRSHQPIDSVPELQIAAGQALSGVADSLYLEERQFDVAGEVPAVIADLVGKLIMHPKTRGRLADQLTVLNNDDFAWFARYGLALRARNVLHKEKKTSSNLWYEEALPTDTVMYTILAERSDGSLSDARGLFEDIPYLQVGGNETVGQGWFAVSIFGGA